MSFSDFSNVFWEYASSKQIDIGIEDRFDNSFSEFKNSKFNLTIADSTLLSGTETERLLDIARANFYIYTRRELDFFVEANMQKSHIFALRYGQEIIGFGMNQRQEFQTNDARFEINHFGATAISSKYTGIGLSNLLNLVRLAHMPFPYASAETYNPCFYRSMQWTARQTGYAFYPSSGTMPSEIPQMMTGMLGENSYKINKDKGIVKYHFNFPIDSVKPHDELREVFSDIYPDGNKWVTSDLHLIYLKRESATVL